MADISINSSTVSASLATILTSNLEPGTNVGYELCKTLWEFHPLGGKMIEKPVRLALSKPRVINIDIHPKDMLIKAFQKEWDSLGATNHIRDVMYITRVYGAGAIVYGAEGVPTSDPIDPWKLPDLNLYFNQLDPLNLAGSIVTNQNPNSPDFQKPLPTITAAGQPYHPSRSCVVFNNTPIYLRFQSSAFGFTGRSVFQRALYPMKSYVQSMITDDMVTVKAGLLVAKMKQSNSIVNRAMQIATGIKRTALQQGSTNNVLSIDVEEEISAIDLNNTATAMTTARDNIISNIAAASDVPAMLLKDEALTNGFGEGSEDAKAIMQYIDGIREDMRSLFDFFDNIVMHRAWNPQFYEAVQNAYPELYKDKSYEEAFYMWKEEFKPEWETLLDEPDSQKASANDVRLKGLTEIARTIMPSVDQANKAKIIQWMADNLNEMPDAFVSDLELDYDEISAYEPPVVQPEEEKIPKPNAS
jgi:hypothetical protein